MRVDIVVYDGVDEMDVLGPLQVLRDATRAGAQFRSGGRRGLERGTPCIAVRPP
jgi:putative intracellular protease/amidase